MNLTEQKMEREKLEKLRMKADKDKADAAGEGDKLTPDCLLSF